MFSLYFSQRPEDQRFKNIYVADSLFPHEFHASISHGLNNGENKIKRIENHEKELIKVAKRDQAKHHWIKERWIQK